MQKLLVHVYVRGALYDVHTTITYSYIYRRDLRRPRSLLMQCVQCVLYHSMQEGDWYQVLS